MRPTMKKLKEIASMKNGMNTWDITQVMNGIQTHNNKERFNDK